MTHRVLVADDDDDVRRLIEMSLTHVGGLEVRAVASGEACLAELDSWTPDVVVLDVMMPGLDGPSTLARIRSRAEGSSVPVVFLTASVIEADVDRLAAQDVSGVLGKPFDPMRLPAELAELLGW